jgi:putative nucleotidyltransferase with HDIG domain
LELSVLVSDPDNNWANELKTFLGTEGYKADISLNGKDCQLLAYRNKYSAVILDLHTTDHSSFEVLKYLRLNCPSVKVIFTLDNAEHLKELELGKEELRKLGVSDILVKPYEPSKILASIEEGSQYEAWRNVKEVSEVNEQETFDADDNEFTKIDVKSFYTGNITIFDHYIRLGRNKYVKILHKGGVFEKDRIRRYVQEKKVEFFYFKTKERSVYINFVNAVLAKMAKSKKIVADKKIKATRSLTEMYIDEVYTKGFKPQLIDEGMKICESMYKMVNRDRELARLLGQYRDFNPPAHTHVFLVSLISTIISCNLEWASERTTEITSFGSLFHDIGKMKLPGSVRIKEKSDFTKEDWEEFKKHPELGAEMLQNFKLINEPVRQIVYQHHEYVNGEGYPNGLTGMKIYPLAKVVSLADEFSNFIVEENLTPIEGLRVFIPDRERVKKFDPVVVKALLNGFIGKSK